MKGSKGSAGLAAKGNETRCGAGLEAKGLTRTSEGEQASESAIRVERVGRCPGVGCQAAKSGKRGMRTCSEVDLEAGSKTFVKLKAIDSIEVAE